MMRRKRRLARWIGIWLVIFHTGENASVADTNQAPTRLPLWTVTGKSNKVHLLGSIHFLKAEYYPLDRVIEQSFSNASTVVFETEIARMEDPKVMRNVAAKGTYPAGKTIQSELNAKTYQQLRKVLQAKIGRPDAFDNMKPFMAAVGLTVMELQRLGYESEAGVDRYFFDKAQKAKKKVRALETVEEQFSLLTGMDKAEQEEFLKATLIEINLFEKSFMQIVDAWKVGDSKVLEQLILAAMKESPELIEKMLIDRNKKWIPQIERFLRDGKDVFIVVGSAHLVGPGNVVELLRSKGIEVQQRTSQ